MSAHSQIIEWSKDQPLWRRDALRRLLSTAFDSKNEDEVFELLRAEHKLQETDIKGQPLLEEHMPTPGASDQEEVTLFALSNIVNANRLAADQKLPFAPVGITLVYGDNGSGKTGYSRILKKACRARVVETILNNVFDKNAPKMPATATFEVGVGKMRTLKTIGWEDGRPGPEELARIAVFDSKCAAVYVDEENQVTFIPYNLDCFEKLAQLCDRLKDRLTSEINPLKAAIVVPVIALSAGTAAHAFVNDLADKTDAEIDAATIWDATHDDRLKELLSLVTDPEKRALELRQLHAQIKFVRDAILRAAPFLSEEAIKELQDKKNAMKMTREAANLAALKTFPKEPISGVGTSPWRMLYEAARTYSEQQVYREKQFPVVGDDSHCVLCQQRLSDDAKDRMVRFEQFVQDQVTKDADSAARKWAAATEIFGEATSSLEPLTSSVSKLVEAEDPRLHGLLGSYLAAAISLRTSITNSVIGESQNPLSDVAKLDTGELDKFLSGLEKRAGAGEAAAKDSTAIKHRQELAELQAHKELHANKAQVQKRIEDHRRMKKLDAAVKACVTTGISQKGTELLKEHVTGEFEAKLVNERKALGIEGLPLRLASRSPKGSPSHQLKLDQTTYSGNTSAVLSEGEHRALALASFLAEQKAVSGSAPIIIDDPVSSLDHERRHRVAHRLIEEAKKRQVIVFTHDLLFYTDATFIAAEKQVPITKIGIKRGPNGHGTIDPDGDPWNAKVLGKRRAWLEQQLSKLKRLHGEGQGEEYEKEARFFYDRLRETWERLIEEGLFASVVVRFRRGVETKRLSEAVIDDALAMRVYHGMSAINEYTAHDRPAAAGPGFPDPSSMKKHLDDLVACYAVIETQSTEAKKRREKLEKPPAQPAGKPA